MLNVRIRGERTPEGRLAAVARELVLKMEEKFEETGKGPSGPDYSDFSSALKPFLDRELLLARIDEVRKCLGVQLTERVKELAVELHACEEAIPEDLRL